MAELDTLMQERLADQLLAFGQAPGRFAVHLGEPALVHNQMDTVVAWALGRTPEAWTERAEALKNAAVLFVLRSCFAAHNNLYQVLGMRSRAFEAAELKARYRALIRLAHPDMNVKGLPANASALVNRAYEVLSDPEGRERYDAELASTGAAGTMAPAAPGYRPQPRYRAELQTEPSWTERLHALTARHPGLVRKGLVGCGVLLAAVVLIWAAASDNHESRMLVAGNMPTTTSNRKAVVPEISQSS
ncbi:MAG: J domain-containing protein, partial [Burkholderiaceae bacterium]